MTLELAHQLALTKLVNLLESLTDPAEIRRVATAILRIKPAKDSKSLVPPVVDQRETAGAPSPQAPISTTPSPHRARSADAFPDDLPLEQLELFRTAFIKRNPARAEEFRAMTPEQFRSHLRDITSVARAHLAKHPPPPDDDPDTD